MSANTIVWFEIPVSDMARAVKFYSETLGVKLEGPSEIAPGYKMAVFPARGKESVHGALVQGMEYQPVDKGALVYFDCAPDLAPALARAKAVGAKILQDKKSIGPHGFMALLLDSEGNRIAFHSPM